MIGAPLGVAPPVAPPVYPGRGLTDSADTMLKLFMETGPIHDIEKFETALRELVAENEELKEYKAMYEGLCK